MSLNIIAKKDLLSIKKEKVSKLLLNFIFSCVFVLLMWVSANSFLYLPFTPVPITMQVLTVLIAPFFLGTSWSVFSQILYLLLGLAGFPIFAGYKSGIIALLGPTGGYIIGFIAASFVTGSLYSLLKNNKNNWHIKTNTLFINKNNNTKNKYDSFESNISNSLEIKKQFEKKELSDNKRQLRDIIAAFIACISGLVVIYFFGYIHLFYFIYTSSFINNVGFSKIALKTFNLGIKPFIIVDLIKIMLILNFKKIFCMKKL